MTTIHLPSSKSICNRVLLLNALSHNPHDIENMSDCDDTHVMVQALHSSHSTIDVGGSGTAMRFLTAFLAQTSGKWILTGSERMLERPIKPLVDTLRQLGGKINYLGQEGYPPLHIEGRLLSGGTCSIDGSFSSQYTSALMMIAPYMRQGLHLHITGEIVSWQYILMTRALMQQFGAEVCIEGPHITIPPQVYTHHPYVVENDWSAASYFYEWMALKEDGELFFPNLKEHSLQGDIACSTLFQALGVNTQYCPEGVYITPNHLPHPKNYIQNLINNPDLAQSIAVTCCMKEIPFQLSGLQTLYIKETDRISALIQELRKLGYLLTADTHGQLVWDGSKCSPEVTPAIHTYNDHRMAMAFAPAKLLHPTLHINNPEVVKKSFPHFWTEFSLLC